MVQCFSQRMPAVPLRRRLLGELRVHEIRERLFPVARRDGAVLRHSLAHGGEEPLHEHTLELQRRFPQPRVGIRRTRRGRGTDGRNRRHRTITSATMAPIARNDSKMAAMSLGGAWTAWSAAATRVTGVPAGTRRLFFAA